MSLSPCTECGRHVRIEETGCPFCGATVSRAPAREPRRIAGPLTRAAIFYFGASLAACGPSGSGGGEQVVQPYGAPPDPPPDDPPPDDTTSDDTTSDDTTENLAVPPVPAYGGAAPPPEQMQAPAYGGPPPSDFRPE